MRAGDEPAVAVWAVLLGILSVVGASAAPLAHVRWGDERAVDAFDRPDVVVRHITYGHAIVEAAQSVLSDIAEHPYVWVQVVGEQDGSPWLREASGRPGGSWTSGDDVIATDGSWWAVATLELVPDIGGVWQRPLPQSVSLAIWKPDDRLSRPAMSVSVPDGLVEVLSTIDRSILAGHVQRLSYDSWNQVARSRFSFRAETLDSAAEYISQQLRLSLEPAGGSVRLAPFKMPPSRIPADFGGDAASFRPRNIVGRLPGTDPAAGTWVVSAHYDAICIDSRQPNWNWKTDPAPGADDNATGIAAVIETARALSKGHQDNGWRWPWGIDFILWSGEEQGLIGSNAYVDSIAAAGELVNGVFNMDMLGGNAEDELRVVDAPGSKWMTDLLRDANDSQGIGLSLRRFLPSVVPVDPKIDYTRQYKHIGARSDHAAFWNHGIPGVLLIEYYLPEVSDSIGSHVPNPWFHSLSDVIDNVNFDLVERTTRLVTATLAGLATSGAGGRPDLTITDDHIRVLGGGAVLFTIANMGTAIAQNPVHVRIASDDGGVIREVVETITEPLQPGQKYYMRVEMGVSLGAKITVHVDTDNRVAESDESNNEAKYPLDIPFVIYPNPSDGRYVAFRFWDAALGYYAPGMTDPSPKFLDSVFMFVEVYAATGERIWDNREDVAALRFTGFREYRWDGRTKNGGRAASGLYLASWRVKNASTREVMSHGIEKFAISR